MRREEKWKEEKRREERRREERKTEEMRRREEERKKRNKWSKVQNENSGEMKFLEKKEAENQTK